MRNSRPDPVHDSIAESGLFKADQIKARAYPFRQFTNAGGNDPYIHIQARIKSGRDARMKCIKTSLLFLLILNLSSCAGQIERQVTETKRCYQNVYGSDVAKDYEVIVINIEGDNLDGEFHWLPAYKDRRVGHFTGKVISLGLADVDYTFYQEGITTKVRLSIAYNEHEVSVQGGEVSMGLESKLPKVDCLSIRTP